MILLGNGDGTFGAPQGFGTNIDVLPSQLATGDFNNDGNLDLVVANAAPNGLGASVLLGHGDGTFSSAPEVNNAGDTPQAVAVGDFNGDTIPDLAFVDDPSGPNGEISIMLGNGKARHQQRSSSSRRLVHHGGGRRLPRDSVVDVATTDNFGNDQSRCGCCPVWATGPSAHR